MVTENRKVKKYKDIKITIIIPLYVICERFFKDLKKFDQLDYDNYEIIIVCDREVDLPKIKNARLLLTEKNRTGPAEKRDLAIKLAKGEICAFIDDDAYPDVKWLSNAIKAFKYDEIIAVGGPGITPSEDGYWEKISGLIYESYFCSGSAQYRFLPLYTRYVEDYPAYNLFVRTKVLKKVGGYKTSFYGGEDTFLCNELIKIGKIYYDPGVLVYHHRRKLFFGLLKQIANVGLHRGYFAKKFPRTSRKWFYFLPSILSILFFAGTILVIIYKDVIPIFLFLLLLFILLGTVSIMAKTRFSNALIVGAGIILVHLSYGISFIRGLLTNNLDR